VNNCSIDYKIISVLIDKTFDLNPLAC